MVVVHTNFGAIKLELDSENAPNTTENFLSYAKKGFYDGTIFHRVIDGFVVQGGGFSADMAEKDSESPIENEAKNAMSNAKGTIAMARTNDPHSASSQFFINLSDNTFLDHQAESQVGWGYCAFGKVVEGIEVVEKMGKAKTADKNGHSDVPVEEIIVERVELVEG